MSRLRRILARPAVRRGLGIGLTLAVLAAAFVVILPRIASYRDVLDTLRDLSAVDLALLAGAVLLNVLTFGPPWMAALPGLGLGHALVLTQTSTAVSNVVPGGEAVGMALQFRMLRVWGFRRNGVAIAVLVTGAWNQLAKVALPLAALVALWLTGETHKLLTLAAFIALAVIVVVLTCVAIALRSDAQARMVGGWADRLLTRVRRLLRRGPYRGAGNRLVRFRHEAVGLLRRRWAPLTAATLAGHLTVFVVLIVCLRTLGVSDGEVSLAEAFAAWTLSRLLTAIPITPGGLGIVELGLTSALIAFGGNETEVVAAVLLYRALTWLPTMAIGLVCALIWRRLHPGEAGDELVAAAPEAASR